VKIEGNNVDPKKQGKGFKSALTFGPGMDQSTVRVSRNNGF
jgi:hypothetical protein